MNISSLKTNGVFKKMKAVLIPFAIFLILTVLLSVISYLADFEYSLIGVITYIILVITIVIASLWMSFLGTGRGWLNGIIGGISVLALIFVAGLIINGSEADILGFLMKVPIFILISFICGIIGINLK